MALKDDLSYKLITFANHQERHAYDLDERVQTVEYMTQWIITLFRDALLSDKAIKAGNNMLPSYDQDTDASDVIMAALDTITND